MYSTTKVKVLQAAAGAAAAAALFAAWPTAGAMENEKWKMENEPKAIGYLVIPGVPRELAEKLDSESSAAVGKPDNERWLAEKLARRERIRAAEPEPEPEPELYTERELELLAITIYCEAGSDTISDETRRMVGEVVLNRVASEAYPDTIEAVLTQRGQYGRFHWTGVVWPARASRSVEAHAVERAYDCARTVFEAERLLPTDTIYQAGFRQGTEVVASAPGFYFCR